VPLSRGLDILLLNVERTYNSTYGVRAAKTNGRTVGLRKISCEKTVDSVMTCERTAMRNWTVRNYSCKLGMCTRGKQARSRNFRNLMEIKLRFYIQLTCKPYTSLLYGPRLFLRLPFVFASFFFSMGGGHAVLTIMLNRTANNRYIATRHF